MSATPLKKHRGPGRPKGSRDARPVLLGLLEKYRLYPVLMAEFEKAKGEMTAKEKFQFSLELARLGIVASPRTTELEGGTSIALYIGGVRQTTSLDGSGPAPAIDVTPSPLALAASLGAAKWKDSRNHTPGRTTERCEALRSPEKPKSPEPPKQEDEPPSRGHIFRVPSFDDTPEAEERRWGGPLDVPGVEDS